MPSISAATRAVPNLRRIPSPGAGRLFRSAAPSGLDPAGISELAGLGVGTIVDLREPFEARARPDYVPAGSRHVSVPLYRGPLPVATPISEVYHSLLTDHGVDIARAVGRIAATLPGGVLVHCAAGKDRTGLVIALILDVAGVPRELILDDYARSGSELPASYRERMSRELTGILGEGAALDTALQLHLDSPAEALAGALDMLDGRYGGSADYLLAYGLHPAELANLRVWLGDPGARACWGTEA